LKLVIRGHFDEVSCLAQLSNTKFISAGLDATLRTWDLSEDPKILEAEILPGEDEKKKKEEEAKAAPKKVMTAEEEDELAALMED
jgi:hypothetical protein